MADSPDKSRKFLALMVAVTLVVAAAGAAVAVDLGSDSTVDTPAGRLSATAPIGSGSDRAATTGSTIYVDLPEDPATGAPSSATSSDDDREDHVSDDRDDHADDDRDDHDRHRDGAEDRDSSERHEGSDDDD